MFKKNKSRTPNELQNSEGEQASKVQELRATIAPLTGRAQIFCSDDCLRRYLRARNWNIQKAKKMLEETLSWRASYKPEEIKWEEVSVEGETGKIQRARFVDNHGRPVLIMIPANENTGSHDGQLRHLVYMLENAILHLPPNQEQFAWIIDFKGWSIAKATPLKTVRETAHILQNHYPERLAVAFLLNPPKIFEVFWKLWKPFVDPNTFQKARFIYSYNEESMETTKDLFDMDKVTSEMETKYNHAEYSELMQQDDVKMAAFWQIETHDKWN